MAQCGDITACKFFYFLSTKGGLISQVLRRTWLNIVFGNQHTGKMLLTDLINLKNKGGGMTVEGCNSVSLLVYAVRNMLLATQACTLGCPNSQQVPILDKGQVASSGQVFQRSSTGLNLCAIDTDCVLAKGGRHLFV